MFVAHYELQSLPFRLREGVTAARVIESAHRHIGMQEIIDVRPNEDGSHQLQLECFYSRDLASAVEAMCAEIGPLLASAAEFRLLTAAFGDARRNTERWIFAASSQAEIAAVRRARAQSVLSNAGERAKMLLGAEPDARVALAELASQLLQAAGMNSAATLAMRGARELQAAEVPQQPAGGAEQPKIYRETYMVTVLKEDRQGQFKSLADIGYAIDEGGCTGSWSQVCIEPITDVAAAREAVAEVGSDPDFFLCLAEDESTSDTSRDQTPRPQGA